MTNDEVRRKIDELEQALLREAIDDIERDLAHDDPALVRRVRRWQRTETTAALLVFLLLTVGAVLLTIGVAIASPPFWLSGIAAFIASFTANAWHERTLKSEPK